MDLTHKLFATADGNLYRVHGVNLFDQVYFQKLGGAGVEQGAARLQVEQGSPSPAQTQNYTCSAA